MLSRDSTLDQRSCSLIWPPSSRFMRSWGESTPVVIIISKALIAVPTASSTRVKPVSDRNNGEGKGRCTGFITQNFVSTQLPLLLTLPISRLPNRPLSWMQRDCTLLAMAMVISTSSLGYLLARWVKLKLLILAVIM